MPEVVHSYALDATKAKGEVWRTAPRIREWVEQPNHQNDESPRDLSIRLTQLAWRHTEPLLKKGRPEEIKTLCDRIVAEVERLRAP